MVDEIRNQKQDRASESDQHANPMGLALAGSDEEKTTKKKNGAETVQRRVQAWQIRDRDQWGKMSGISIRIRKTQRTNGANATTARVRFSNFRCMKCMATKLAFHTAKITRSATSSIFGKPIKTFATYTIVSTRRT